MIKKMWNRIRCFLIRLSAWSRGCVLLRDVLCSDLWAYAFGTHRIAFHGNQWYLYDIMTFSNRIIATFCTGLSNLYPALTFKRLHTKNALIIMCYAYKKLRFQESFSRAWSPQLKVATTLSGRNPREYTQPASRNLTWRKQFFVSTTTWL